MAQEEMETEQMNTANADSSFEELTFWRRDEKYGDNWRRREVKERKHDFCLKWELLGGFFFFFFQMSVAVLQWRGNVSDAEERGTIGHKNDYLNLYNKYHWSVIQK